VRRRSAYSCGSCRCRTRTIPCTRYKTKLLDVKLDPTRIYLFANDGGKLVPPSFVRATFAGDHSTPAGIRLSVISSPSRTNAFNQAPFDRAPQNGGKDPETGLGFVKLNIVLTIFGQTLAGDRVQGSASFPINFCFNCGGCF